MPVMSPSMKSGFLLAMCVSCAAKDGNCGSGTTALLNRSSLTGSESGLLGGYIMLGDGRQCTAVFDVTKQIGTSSRSNNYSLNVWTAKHCDLKEEDVVPEWDSSGTTRFPGFEISIFGNKGYYKVKALSRISEVLANHYSPLQANDALKNIAPTLMKTSFVAASQSIDGAQRECARVSREGDYCVTFSDTTVFDALIGEVFGSKIDPDLDTILAAAFDKRENIRNGVPGLSGPKGDAASMSTTIEEYWGVWRIMPVAPLVDIWLACTKDMAAGLGAAPAVGGSAAGSRQSRVGASSQAWQVEVLDSMQNLDPAQVQIICGLSEGLRAGFRLSAVLGRTVEDHLKDAGINPGKSASDGQTGHRSFTEYLVKREQDLRGRLLSLWSGLSSLIVSEGSAADLVVHTNIASVVGRTSSVPVERPSVRSDSFAVYQIGKEWPVPRVLPTGLYFARSDNDPISFGKGDSGSLFSFAGQFPLLVLNSVDGKGTSGGVAVLPLPVPAREAGGSAGVGRASNTATSSSGPTNSSGPSSSSGPSRDSLGAEGAPGYTGADAPSAEAMAGWSGTSVDPTGKGFVGLDSGSSGVCN